MARMPGFHLYFEGHPGIFNDHKESGPRFNVSSKGWCLLTVYIYAFSRRFYSKQLTVHSGYTFFQYACSLGI